MAAIELRHAGPTAYREALPSGAGAERVPVLLIHGYPQSSYMWRHLIPRIADAGRRVVAPDLAGYGDSEADPPATWERHIENLERFCSAVGLERVILGAHDWGGLIGMRWACERPGVVTALILSNTGFFPDVEWTGLGKLLRTPGQGEQLLDNLTRDAFATMLGDWASTGSFDAAALDEYWKGYTSAERRRGHLELYRSGDFDKIGPYEDRLAELAVPTLLLWGAQDPAVPVAAADRFHAELPDTRLVILEDAGHFLYEDDPERCGQEVVDFLAELD